MKIYICGSKYINELDKETIKAIKKHVEKGNEILVGDDANGIDTLIQSVLRDYDKVTVYSPFEEARVNLGNWPVVQAGRKERLSHMKTFYFAKDAKMASDADMGLVIWDGFSVDAFINMLNIVVQHKNAEILRSGEGLDLLTSEFKDLEKLIAKNRQFVSETEHLPKDLYEPAIKSCGLSKDMEDFYIENMQTKGKLYDIILGAPVSIEKKKEILKPLLKTDDLFQELYGYEEAVSRDSCYIEESGRAYIAEDFIYTVLSHSFSKLYYEICRAMKEQSLRKGEYLIVNSCDYDIDLFGTDRHLFAPFTSFEAAMSAIKEDIKYEMDEGFAGGEPIRWWYEIEKWAPVGDGSFEKTYTYFVDRDELLYFERHEKEKLDLNEYKPLSREEEDFDYDFDGPAVDVFYSYDFFDFLKRIIRAADKDYRLLIEDYCIADFDPYIEMMVITESVFRALRKMYVDKDTELLEQLLYVIMGISSAFGIEKKNKDVTRIHKLDIEGRIPLIFRFMNDKEIIFGVEEEKLKSDSIFDKDDGDSIYDVVYDAVFGKPETRVYSLNQFLNRHSAMIELVNTQEDYERFRDEPSEFQGYIRGDNLNLPVPFKPGDIVKLDVMPFSDKKHAVIMEKLNQYDCCAVQIFFYDEKSKLYDTGALKHARGLNPDTVLSPLYRLEKYDGELDDNEEILREIGKYIDGDGEKGRTLWNKMNGILSGTKGKSRKTETKANTADVVRGYING